MEDRILIVDDGIALTDSFDAMTSLRPHRRAIPVDEVVEEMERGKGKQFDPRVLEIFLKEKIYDKLTRI